MTIQYAGVTLSIGTWCLVTAALEVLAEATPPDHAARLHAAADAIDAGVKYSIIAQGSDHPNGSTK